MLPTEYKKVKKWTTPEPALSGIVLDPERFGSTPRTKGGSMSCAGLSPLLPTLVVVLRECTGGLLLSEWHKDLKMGVFFCIYCFRNKGKNLYPIMIILRTGKSSIILGLSKILKLVSIDHLLRDIAMNWLNVINIWLWMFAKHHRLLGLILILDFIMTLRLIT